MQYKAFYRKYRPQSFTEIISQENIIKILRNSILNNNFTHAYLFSGAKGTGKTSTAKIFAKAINCKQKNEGDACNNCQNCNDINNNNGVDILEIDGASNNGVDEIRKIKDNINLLPMNFEYKVYIIDEVHMLTTAAFNALLKTLEEPPQHIIFILATTEPYKVLSTIISRCQWFEFKKIATVNMKQQFLKVLQSENIKFEPEALDEIALLSDGSLRDGLNFLEKIYNYAEQITIESVEKIFSVLSTKNKIKFLINIFNCNMQEIIMQLELFNQYTIEYKKFIIDFIYIIEDILIYQITKEATILKTITLTEVAYFAPVVKNDLYALLNAFNEILLQENVNDLKPILILKILNLINNFTNKYVLVFSKNKSIDTNEIFQTEAKTNIITKHKTTSSLEKKVETTINKPQQLIKKALPFENEVLNVLSDTNSENNEIIDKAINLILQADIKIRKNITKKWDKINDFVNDNKFRNITKFYINTLVTAATKNAFIVIVENIIQANLINEKFLTKEHRNFLNILLGKEYMIYALDKKQWQITRKKYQVWQKDNLLPQPVPITITSPNIDTVSEVEQDPTLTFVQKLFTEVEEI